MKQSVYCILIMFIFAINVLAQDNASLSQLRHVASESRVLDEAYLLRVSQENPQLIERWHIMMTESWELRTHPASKPISTKYKVLEEHLWHNANVLDLELARVIARDLENEVYYRIGETSTFLILKPISFVNQRVNESRKLSQLTQKSKGQR